MLELYQLEQLLAVAKHGTLSSAAEAIHLSQPAISRSMQKLERELEVPLFIRGKNRIELNENGKLAAQCAQKVLDQISSMVSAVREHDRRQRTISVGSCAPAPLWSIMPALSYIYPEMTIASDIRDVDPLIRGLGDGTYQMIVLPYNFQREGVECVEYMDEHLLFSLPSGHPLSGSRGLYFKDLNGGSMLLRPQLGFWSRIHSEKMPDTHFLEQQDSAAFYELVRTSSLPSFSSDIVIGRDGRIPGRVLVPILDPEANVTYHICYAAENSQLIRPFIRSLGNGAAPEAHGF